MTTTAGFPSLDTHVTNSEGLLQDPWVLFLVNLWQKAGGNVVPADAYYLSVVGSDLFAINSLTLAAIRILTFIDFDLLQAEIDLLNAQLIGLQSQLDNLETLTWAIRR